MKRLTSILLAFVTVLCAFSGTTVFAGDENIPYHICEYEPYVEKVHILQVMDILRTAKKALSARCAVIKRMLRLSRV